MLKRKICVVTGSRADYGLLYWLMKDIQAGSLFELQLVVTGMHLSPEFGMTVNIIEHDGFEITRRVETLMSSDSAVGITKSVGLGVINFADVFEQLRPDLVLVLGDRFEIFAAAQAALLAKLPIAHIGGGDVTEGAYDEAMRHSISKMSHLHFVTNTAAANRLKHMGEDPKYVFNVGSPGLDHLHRSTLPDRATLEKELGFNFRKLNFLITFHPVTLDMMSSAKQFDSLLQALEKYGPDVGLIFTLPNADTEGRDLIRLVEKFVADRDNACAYPSLGQRRYLGTMAVADVVIGNSSSGLYEAPSFQTPTVNIGLRQQGRLKADSIFDCSPTSDDILNAITKAMNFGSQKAENPYQKGDCAELIMKELNSIDDFNSLTMKHFYENSKPC
jgi:UDP-hydrolysing UDP-N-acetyl-D-glucosamine 2-epimerase